MLFLSACSGSATKGEQSVTSADAGKLNSDASGVHDNALRTEAAIAAVLNRQSDASKANIANADDIDELARRFGHKGLSRKEIRAVIISNREKIADQYHKLLLTPADVDSITLANMRPGYARRYLELIYWPGKTTKRTFLVTFVRRTPREYLYKVEQDVQGRVFSLRTDHQSKTLQDSLLANINAYVAANSINRDRFSPHACEFELGRCEYLWSSAANPEAGITVDATTRYADFTWIQELRGGDAIHDIVESVFDKQGLLLHRAVMPKGENARYFAKEWVRIE